MLRAAAEVADLADRICEAVAVDPVDRDFLELLIRHYRDGGIVVHRDGGVVLTWTDAGVSRRRAHGEWG